MNQTSEIKHAYIALIEDIGLELLQLDATRAITDKLIVVFQKVADDLADDLGGSAYRNTLSILIKLQEARQTLDGKIAALHANKAYYENRFNQFLEANEYA